MINLESPTAHRLDFSIAKNIQEIAIPVLDKFTVKMIGIKSNGSYFCAYPIFEYRDEEEILHLYADYCSKSSIVSEIRNTYETDCDILHVNSISGSSDKITGLKFLCKSSQGVLNIEFIDSKDEFELDSIECRVSIMSA